MNLRFLEVDHSRAHYHRLRGAVREAFLERLVLSWIYHDHGLEGVVLSEEDLQRYLGTNPMPNYTDRMIQRSLGRMKTAVEFLFAAAAEARPIDLELVRELHVMLSEPGDEAAGRYRKRNSSPGVYNLKIVPAKSISYYLRRLLTMWDEELSQLHPVRGAAALHWEFMRVFPFDERSGFAGRLLMNYALLLQDYPPAIIHRMNRHHYFGALDGPRATMTPVVLEAIEATNEAARAFSAHFVEPRPALAAY